MLKNYCTVLVSRDTENPVMFHYFSSAQFAECDAQHKHKHNWDTWECDLGITHKQTADPYQDVYIVLGPTPLTEHHDSVFRYAGLVKELKMRYLLL